MNLGSAPEAMDVVLSGATESGGAVTATLTGTVLGNDCEVAGVLVASVDAVEDVKDVEDVEGVEGVEGVDVDSLAPHADNMLAAANADKAARWRNRPKVFVTSMAPVSPSNATR